MACRPQGNPRSSSSDRVPPELEVLGLRKALCAQPVWPVGATSLTGRRGLRLVLIVDCDLAHSSACVLANSASTHYTQDRSSHVRTTRATTMPSVDFIPGPAGSRPVIASCCVPIILAVAISCCWVSSSYLVAVSLRSIRCGRISLA